MSTNTKLLVMIVAVIYVIATITQVIAAVINYKNGNKWWWLHLASAGMYTIGVILGGVVLALS